MARPVDLDKREIARVVSHDLMPHIVRRAERHPRQDEPTGDTRGWAKAQSEFAAFQSIPEKKATAKLRKHYKRLGFEHLAGSELMFRSTAHRRKYLRFDLEPDVMASLAQKARDLPERSLHDEDSARSRGSLEH